MEVMTLILVNLHKKQFEDINCKNKNKNKDI